MTLIASWGGADSNAYIDLTQANSYICSAIFANASWTAATDQQKEAALISASNDVDSRQYIGIRYYEVQRLEFPRQIRSQFPFNRTSSETLTQDTIQLRMQFDVQQATAIQANFIARNGGVNQHLENLQNGIVGISESIGPIREFVQYGQRATSARARISNDALTLLANWMTSRKIYRA